MSKLIKNVTTKLYAYSFFDDLILIYPLYAVMFADSGLNAAKISSLLVVWSLTAFVLEIPFGSLADKYPRKNVLLAGILIRSVGYLLWLFWRSYASFLIGFILWGIKSALTSGTTEALVYDELAKSDNTASYAKVMGKMEAYSLAGIVLASFGASILAAHGYSPILVLSVIAACISGIAVALLPAAKKIKAADGARYLDYFKEGIGAVMTNATAVYIVLFMSVVAGLGAIDEYFGLFFKEKGFSNSLISFWTAVIFLFGAIGSIFAHKLEKKKLPINAALFIWAALLFAATVTPTFIAPLILGLYIMFLFGVQVLFNSYLQNHLADKTRATATSVGGFAAEFFAVMSFLVVSFGATRSSYAYSYKLISYGVVLFAVLLLLYSIKVRKKNPSFF